MANNTYTPENDLDLTQSLDRDTTYTPENDLSLDASLISVPQLGTLTANASATGETLNLITSLFPTTAAAANASGDTSSISGSSTLDTVTASATGSGGTSNLQDTGVDVLTPAAASATGGVTQIDVTGTEALEVPGDAAANGAGSSIGLTPRIGLTGASASATGGADLGLEIDLFLVDEEATATGTGGEATLNTIGTGGEVTVLIEGERIDTYTNIEVEKRLNEVDTFAFEAFITDDNDRALINEGNTVKIVENYNDLLFKGRLTEVEYKSNFRAKCEGDGMVDKLLNRKTDRDTYSNTAGDDIVKSEVSSSVISYGDIEAAPQVSIRFDHDNLARAVAGVANATGYDWYIDQDETDDYDTDYLNFVKDAGSNTVQETFEIGNNARMVERNKDEGFIANDITLLGRGDGINQLEARVFAASTAYTDTTQIITESEGTSFTVADTSQLGATNDNLLVRVGTEVMDVTITDGTTLSVNGRGLNNFEGDGTDQIKHYDGVRVWRIDNKTTGVGRFSPDNPESGSSIDTHNVKEQRETDKTIVDLSTLEKAADLDLKNRFEDVFRIQVKATEPRVTENLGLGDRVDVKDVTAMSVDDSFNVVGMDIRRSSSDEGTVLHLANRPRRLTERLSEIESDRDTLNAHMQGATNFNGEHFEDNCDNAHPLNNSIFIPDDVVSINKFELTFKRESFRGYVQDQGHNHNVTVNHPSHSHDVNIGTQTSQGSDTTLTQIDSQSDTANLNDGDSLFVTETSVNSYTGSNTTIRLRVEDNDGSSFTEYSVRVINLDTAQVYYGKVVQKRATDFYDTIAVSENISGDEIRLEVENRDNESHSTTAEMVFFGEDNHNHDVNIGTQTSDAALGTSNTETSTSAGNPSYGIFEPTTESDVDVDVKVDGNLVTTVTNVSVGDEISTPIDLKPHLSDPLTGSYHNIELVPTGRSRLTADVTEKVFIESTL